MRTPKLLLSLFMPFFLLSCNQNVETKKSASPKIILPSVEREFVEQLDRAGKLVADSLEDDRKAFLVDSLKNAVDLWLSNKTGLKADRWVGIVMNDTLGQSFGAGRGNVLQVYIPNYKGSSNGYTKSEGASSVTVTMGIDEGDREMFKARQQLFDGDTVVFSGHFTRLSDGVPDFLGESSGSLESANLDFTPTELYKKSKIIPVRRPIPDTAGLAKSPVRVTANIVAHKSDNQRFITIKVTVKNISSKPITSLRVLWFVANKAGQPAVVNGATGVWWEGYFNRTLEPGEITSEEWQHESPDGQNIKLIYPKWVALHNGLKWKPGKS